MGASQTTIVITDSSKAACSRSREATQDGDAFINFTHQSSTLPFSGMSSAGGRPATTESSDKRRLALLIFFNVLLSGLLVAVSVSLFRHHSNKQATPPVGLDGDGHPLLLEDAPFCLPCREVYLTDQDVEENVYKVTTRWDKRENITLCCGESHDDLSMLIGRMYNRVHYLRDRARGLATWKKADSKKNVLRDGVVSHLLLQLKIDNSELSAESNGSVVVPLRPHTGERKAANVSHNNNDDNTTAATTETRYAADVSNGSVRIQHTGLYYVYSHLPFKFKPTPSTSASLSSSSSSGTNSGSTTSSGEKQASQFVVRVRDGRELVLLENSVYPCVIGSPRRSCEYSFVGGTFMLHEKDELSLRISHDACFEKDKEMNFGVQLM